MKNFFLLLAIFAFSCSDFDGSNPAVQTEQTVNGRARYIVFLKTEATKGLAGRLSLRPIHTLTYSTQAYVAELFPFEAANLMLNPEVESVEEDFRISVLQTLPWGIDRVDADISSTKAGDGIGDVSGPIAYIMDTGIQFDHPDLNVIGGKDFTYENTGGYDTHGHGTHVAGTVAAKDNGSFVVGVAPSVALYSTKVLDKYGYGWWSGALAAVDFITEQKILNPSVPMVVNMSFAGSKPPGKYKQMIEKPFLNSMRHGVVYVAAAGNASKDAKDFYPAGIRGLLTIAAYDVNNNSAWFTNYGSVIDFYAPGVNILSTYLGGGTKTASGTSMAAPHVVGTVALLFSSSPNLSVSEVESALIGAAEQAQAEGLNPPILNVQWKTTDLSIYAGKF